ncbi:MAG: putative 3-deoxy-D-manno-octulosonate 8-phosphate phosphatase [Pseudomonadota bacterium]|jgi:lipopolysaccharide export system protein LptC
MKMTATPSLTHRLRLAWDRLAVYFPIFLMAVMALTSYWLVRNTPTWQENDLQPAPRHVPDYFMKDFSVRVYAADGRLKSELFGSQGKHFPDTDTVEVTQPRVRSFGTDGRVTTARAETGVVNADGSEIQLFKKAVVVREALGKDVPSQELQSEFLHLFANTETIRSHLPIVMLRGDGDRFTADRMEYDNVNRWVHLQGRVHGVLMPRKHK